MKAEFWYFGNHTVACTVVWYNRFATHKIKIKVTQIKYLVCTFFFSLFALSSPLPAFFPSFKQKNSISFLKQTLLKLKKMYFEVYLKKEFNFWEIVTQRMYKRDLLHDDKKCISWDKDDFMKRSQQKKWKFTVWLADHTLCCLGYKPAQSLTKIESRYEPCFGLDLHIESYKCFPLKTTR